MSIPVRRLLVARFRRRSPPNRFVSCHAAGVRGLIACQSEEAYQSDHFLNLGLRHDYDARDRSV